MRGRGHAPTCLVKVVIVGDSHVGKSSLLVRFADQTFTLGHKGTIGVDFRFRTLVSAKRVVKLQIWDTAGQERFRTMTSAYYRGAAGFVVCFDLTVRDSFDAISSWLEELEAYRENGRSVVVLCGTKADMHHERMVERDEVDALGKRLGLAYFETSSKNDVNVEELFLELTKEMVARRKQHEDAEAASFPTTALATTAKHTSASARSGVNLVRHIFAPSEWDWTGCMGKYHNK